MGCNSSRIGVDSFTYVNQVDNETYMFQRLEMIKLELLEKLPDSSFSQILV